MNPPRTPYYLIDEGRLLRNLEVIRRVRESSGAKSLLALKCFSTWSVFELMSRYMDGTTSSSPFEARLGHERFGGETHAYSVAFSAADIADVATFADKVIFNSISQLRAFHDPTAHRPVGLRVNPGVSHSSYDLADPARRFSRLGATDVVAVHAAAPLLSGLMFHFNCENDDVESLSGAMQAIGDRYGSVLDRMEWVSLGGGISFTSPGFPVGRFCTLLRDFSSHFGVQVYLEPGEAAVTSSTELVTTVLDVVHNELDVAIVDASVEAHCLDHLIYGTTPRLSTPPAGPHRTMITGRSCLAGDVFGEHGLERPLCVGDEVRMDDAGGYTMVKKTWFCGAAMPSIVVRRLDGTVEIVREFGYHDFATGLS